MVTETTHAEMHGGATRISLYKETKRVLAIVATGSFALTTSPFLSQATQSDCHRKTLVNFHFATFHGFAKHMAVKTTLVFIIDNQHRDEQSRFVQSSLDDMSCKDECAKLGASATQECSFL